QCGTKPRRGRDIVRKRVVVAPRASRRANAFRGDAMTVNECVNAGVVGSELRVQRVDALRGVTDRIPANLEALRERRVLLFELSQSLLQPAFLPVAGDEE